MNGTNSNAFVAAAVGVVVVEDLEVSAIVLTGAALLILLLPV